MCTEVNLKLRYSYASSINKHTKALWGHPTSLQAALFRALLVTNTTRQAKVLTGGGNLREAQVSAPHVS
jgi:hypothetical protein